MPEFTVHLCGPQDRPEQARLFNACFKKGADADDLAWRYDRGPHGAAVSLVARPPGGDGICGYACSPRKALVRGDESTLAAVGETGDVMTHPDWRKQGIFSHLDRRCMEETASLGWPLAFGLPNRRSAHIFLRLGWEQVGTVRPWTFLLRADEVAKREEFKQGRLRALFRGRNRAGCERARRALGAAGTEAAPLERFPDEVGELSRAVEPRFGFMVRRDAAYLNWRFRENPSGLHSAVGLRRDGELVGYAVVQKPRGDDGVGYLVDVLAADDEVARACVGAGLARLEELDASVVRATAIDGSWWAGILEGAGFLRPRDEDHLIVILHPHRPDHPLVAAARDTASWYFTDGDRDDETMG